VGPTNAVRLVATKADTVRIFHILMPLSVGGPAHRTAEHWHANGKNVTPMRHSERCAALVRKSGSRISGHALYVCRRSAVLKVMCPRCVPVGKSGLSEGKIELKYLISLVSAEGLEPSTSHDPPLHGRSTVIETTGLHTCSDGQP
jgi:hypothetical protein